ncbi:MAG: cupin domain-containing protein [Pirellulales bacterium]
MRPVISDLLWIGNARDLSDVKTALALGVRAIVDVAANEAPVVYPRDITYCRLPLVDGGENDEAILRLAVSTTAKLIKSGVPTLVACSAGMSRSLAVTAAALAIAERQSPDAVLARIAAAGPHDLSGPLWMDIKRLCFADREPTPSDSVAGENLLADVPEVLPDELIDVLLTADNVRIERIVSRGHVSPPGFWYDQPQDEWVLVVSGAARLSIEGGEPLELRAGSYVNLPAHTRHRVEWTAPDEPTVWLAVHYG